MRGIGARGGSGKGRKRLIIGIIIVVLIIIGVACGGKGGNTSEDTSKPSRNGFDASTNKEIVLATDSLSSLGCDKRSEAFLSVRRETP